MKKKNIVKNSEDFTRIISKKQGVVNNYFIINMEENNNLIPKFGITFVKNMCNAVNRNKLKRQVKSIVLVISCQNNFRGLQPYLYNIVQSEDVLLVVYWCYLLHFYQLFGLVRQYHQSWQ